MVSSGALASWMEGVSASVMSCQCWVGAVVVVLDVLYGNIKGSLGDTQLQLVLV
jgi:hypothetical protein